MIQEILDEVLDTSLQPDTNPRYTIRDNNGRIINDDVQIDFKTPVLQNPTPLNRATLSNMLGDLYTQDRYSTPTYSGNAMTLNLPLTSYEVDKIIRIKAPATLTNPTLNINNLGTKTINGTIQSGLKYELVYNGTSFDIYKPANKATDTQASQGTDDNTYMTPKQIKTNYIPSANMSIKTGTISSGSTIPKTEGYTNYVYFVSVNKADAFDTITGAEFNPVYSDTYIDCSVDQSTRKVSCHAGYRYETYSSSAWGLEEGTANYIEFAWN